MVDKGFGEGQGWDSGSPAGGQSRQALIQKMPVTMSRSHLPGATYFQIGIKIPGSGHLLKDKEETMVGLQASASGVLPGGGRGQRCLRCLTQGHWVSAVGHSAGTHVKGVGRRGSSQGGSLLPSPQHAHRPAAPRAETGESFVMSAGPWDGSGRG